MLSRTRFPIAEDDERGRALSDLIDNRQPILDVVKRVQALPWDSEQELAVLDRSAAISALRRYRSSELTAGDVETWAEAIEAREDIGYEAGHEETLSRFVFETANPSLAEALTDHYAVSWIERMTSRP